MFEEGSVAAMVVPALAGVVLSMVVCTALGVVIEGRAYKPLRQAPSLAVLITAIGVSYFLQNAALLLWSSSPKIFSPIVGSGQLQVGPLNISYVTLVTIVACIVILGLEDQKMCIRDRGGAASHPTPLALPPGGAVLFFG